jgi:hypothetical protein
MGTDEPGFAVSKVHIGLTQLGAAGPEALDFPAFENEARFEMSFDGIVVPRAPIDSDGLPCGRSPGRVTHDFLYSAIAGMAT